MGVTWEESSKFMEVEGQLEKAKKFVNKNIHRRISNSVLRCSDGRTTEKEAVGGIRIFGADLGVLFAVSEALDSAGIKYASEKLVERYLRTKKSPEIKTDGKIHYHTDTHNKEHEGVGCGHIREFVDNAKFAGIWNAVLALSEEDRSELVLHGDHKEQGVLIIDSADFTVDSTDGDNQYFVFDKKRGREFIDKIVPALGFERLMSDNVWKSYERQMGETAKVLAKGRPQFRVFEEDGEVEVQPLEKVA